MKNKQQSKKTQKINYKITRLSRLYSVLLLNAHQPPHTSILKSNLAGIPQKYHYTVITQIQLTNIVINGMQFTSQTTSISKPLKLSAEITKKAGKQTTNKFA